MIDDINPGNVHEVFERYIVSFVDKGKDDCLVASMLMSVIVSDMFDVYISDDIVRHCSEILGDSSCLARIRSEEIIKEMVENGVDHRC